MWHNVLRALLPRREVAYDESFFREQWFSGWDVLRHVLEQLVREQPAWRRVLDFGCGPGVMIDHMNERGYHYVGCDYSEEARKLYLQHFGKHPERYLESLDALDPADFDVFLSFDVFEHMTDAQIGAVLQRVRPIPALFLNISRDWRTPGHINIKSDRAWLSFFRRHGLVLHENVTSRLRERYAQLRPGCPDRWERNMFILSRSNA